jgi:hypothetical protein
MMMRDVTGRSFPQIGVSDPHHALSHEANGRSNDPTKPTKFATVNTYHTSLFAKFVTKLAKTPDGDGSLLDHSMVLYGSAMSDANQHNHGPLPVILAGGASGRLQGGRHLRNAPDTTMSNLLLAMLDKLGVPSEKFGDSTGMLAI